MEEFLKKSQTLIENEGHTVKELVRLLRSFAVELSKDKPPIKIVYCATFGAFGYSDAYLDFVDVDQVDELYFNRVDNDIEKNMISFAEFILNKYHDLDKILKIYYKYKIFQVFDRATTVSNNLLVVTNLLLENDFSTEETESITDDSIFYCANKFKKFTRDQLLSFQQIMVDFLNRETDSLCARTYKFKKEDKTHVQRNSYISFADSDIENLIPDMWSQQNHFDPCQMRFIQWCIKNHPSDFDVDDWSLYNDELIYIGLMLASSRHCKLDYVDVPFYSDWRITDYEGRERVTYR